MAIIQCPGCGKNISDKAEACPHCGKTFKTGILCEECGEIIPEGCNACPNCGCPIPQKEKLEQPCVSKKENTTMKPCETCGKLIAKSAKKCPHCGAKIKHKNGCFAALLVFFIIILVAFASLKVMSYVKENEQTITMGGQTITLKDFAEDIDNNDVKFKTKYKGKEVTIVGRITDIKDGYYSTNLGHTFSSLITINCGKGQYNICVEAGSTSFSSKFEVGDLIKVKGKFSTDLYSDFYMYGPNTIVKISE